MDGGAAARIARFVTEGSPTGEPLRVLEIGAGTGRLTEALLQSGTDLTVVEIDHELVRVLNERPELQGVRIIEDDALAFDFNAYAAGTTWRAVGNLPYNIATPLIVGLVEMASGPERIVAMVQKDVADRLAARPGSAAYGSLSVAVQYAMTVERALTLGPNAFYPRPAVDSTVVRLMRRERPAVDVADVALFRQVVRAAFAYRRKTLANSLALALGIARETAARGIERAGLNMEIRGEQLALDDFARLTATLER